MAEALFPMLLLFLGFALDLHGAMMVFDRHSTASFGAYCSTADVFISSHFPLVKFLLTYMSNSVQDLSGENRVKHSNIVCSGFRPSVYITSSCNFNVWVSQFKKLNS
jgi:hypothetical protein